MIVIWYRNARWWSVTRSVTSIVFRLHLAVAINFRIAGARRIWIVDANRAIERGKSAHASQSAERGQKIVHQVRVSLPNLLEVCVPNPKENALFVGDHSHGVGLAGQECFAESSSGTESADRGHILKERKFSMNAFARLGRASLWINQIWKARVSLINKLSDFGRD